jgi:hypothetical protein
MGHDRVPDSTPPPLPLIDKINKSTTVKIRVRITNTATYHTGRGGGRGVVGRENPTNYVRYKRSNYHAMIGCFDMKTRVFILSFLPYDFQLPVYHSLYRPL